MSDLRWEDLAETFHFEEFLDEFGIRVVDVSGKGWHQASCPLDSHPGKDNSPSFAIGEHELAYNCFTCDEKGALPRLVIQLEHLEDDEVDTAWQKALQRLLPFSDFSDDIDRQFLERMQKAMSGDGRPPKRPRRVTLPQIRLGSCRSLQRLLWPYWRSGGSRVRTQLMRSTSAMTLSDAFGKNDESYTGPALVIPHFFKGNLVGWQERWLDPDRPKWIPKYTNSRDFPKKETLFNWDRVARLAEDEPVVTVESAMTAIRLTELDYLAVATFSAQMSTTQEKMLMALPGLVSAYDDDPRYKNNKGEWVEGAGTRANRNLRNLAHYVPVYKIPAIGKEKGDLADLEDDEIHALFEQATSV